MHIVWDWNGTLLADIDAVVAAANHELVRRGGRALPLEEYRAQFSRPVRHFNERLLGRALPDAEWAELDAGFHAHYWGAVDAVPLADAARTCLERVQALGWSQSLLSMAPHHHVTQIVADRGLAPLLARVDGNHGEVGAGKEANLRAHLGLLGVDAADAWLIGDAVDDALAAHAVGAGVVLVAGASCHSRAVLDQAGAPVVDTLVQAVDLLQGLAPSGTPSPAGQA